MNEDTWTLPGKVFAGDMSPLGKSKPLHIDEAGRAINFLQGKVLTSIETLNLPFNQEKAIKDLIKGFVSDCHMNLMGIAYPEVRIMTESEAEITGAMDASRISNSIGS